MPHSGAAVAAAAQPAPAATAAPLCGITAPDVAGYRAKTVVDPRFKAAGGDALHETYSADAIQAIWTFVTPRHPAFPATLCRQVVTKDGLMEIDRQIRCEGKPAACAAFAKEVDAMDDGSGDGQ